MEDVWYYADGGELRGPIRRMELVRILQQTASPLDVLVWREGLADWIAVERVGELAVQLMTPTLPPRRTDKPPTPTMPNHTPAISHERAAAAAIRKTAGSEPHGIGGWLALVALGQLLGVARLVIDSAEYYSRAETRAAFSEFPVAMFGELVILLLLFGLYVAVAILFFRESRHFPRWFIIQCIAAIGLPLLNHAAIAFAVAQATGQPISGLNLEPMEIVRLVAALIVAPIWILYILRSRRVKNTFTT